MNDNQWVTTWSTAIVITLAGILAWEWAYATLGGRQLPVADDREQWIDWRERVNHAEADALILTGASRMQLNIDLATLVATTGRNVYQLSIDGTSALPVLYDLADDSRIRGTIVISVRPHDLTGRGGGPAQAAVNDYHVRRDTELLSPSDYTERQLEKLVFEALPSRAQGVRPESLFALWFRNQEISNYLVTFATREREADYSKVSIEALRKFRLERNRDGYRKFGMADKSEVMETLEKISRAVQQIQERGGTVIFVRFPISDALLQASEKYLPEAEYLGKLGPVVGAPLIDLNEYPEFRKFDLPDGSHIDRKDQNAFTRIFARHLLEKLDSHK